MTESNTALPTNRSRRLILAIAVVFVAVAIGAWLAYGSWKDSRQELEDLHTRVAEARIAQEKLLSHIDEAQDALEERQAEMPVPPPFPEATKPESQPATSPAPQAPAQNSLMSQATKPEVSEAQTEDQTADIPQTTETKAQIPDTIKPAAPSSIVHKDRKARIARALRLVRKATFGFEHGRDRDSSLDALYEAWVLLEDIDDWSAYPADPRVALEQEIELLANYRPAEPRDIAREILEVSQLTRNLHTQEFPIRDRHLRRALKMELGHARLAVLRRDMTSMSRSLEKVRELLNTRFLHGHSRDDVLERLNRISNWTPTEQTPHLGATLAILDQRAMYRGGRNF